MEVDAIGCTSVDFGTWDDDFFGVKGRSSTKVSDVAKSSFEELEEATTHLRRPLGASGDLYVRIDSSGKAVAGAKGQYESADAKKVIEGSIEVDNRGNTSGQVSAKVNFQNER